MNLLGKSEGMNELVNFDNPFSKDKVDEIWFWIRKSPWNTDKGKITYQATIKFKNKNTEGTQKIDADSFLELVKLVEQFIETL